MEASITAEASIPSSLKVDGTVTTDTVGLRVVARTAAASGENSSLPRLAWRGAARSGQGRFRAVGAEEFDWAGIGSSVVG